MGCTPEVLWVSKGYQLFEMLGTPGNTGAAQIVSE
jgi:hypothetical protein